jgi:hypothetical protein
LWAKGTRIIAVVNARLSAWSKVGGSDYDEVAKFRLTSKSTPASSDECPAAPHLEIT